MDYRVKLDSYEGPMDLLLHLIKKDEVDILDIAICKVAEQFKEYLFVIQILDLGSAGDFLVMASKLMEIKSELLLPRQTEKSEKAEETRNEIVRQLMEYRKYKEAVDLLDERAETNLQKIPRQQPEVPISTNSLTEKPIQEVELWDLVSAFGRIMRETMVSQSQEIVVDITPMEVYVEEITQRLSSHGKMAFRDLFNPPFHKLRLIGLFLAILELIKKHSIQAVQSDSFGEIQITWIQRVELF